MQNSEYRDRWGISQSAIKDFQFKSPKKWKEVWIDKRLDPSKNDDNFIMGSLIDTLLFSPGELEKRYYIGEEKLPSKAIASIIKSYYNKILSVNEELKRLEEEIPGEPDYMSLTLDHVDVLLDCANAYCYKDGDEEKCGWNTGWKADTRIRFIAEKGEDYFNSLIKANNRKIISHEMNVEAINLRDILYKDPEVKDFFVESEGNKLMFQLEIFINYTLLEVNKEVPLKGALDIVRFNHKDRTVQIIDFKSSYSAFNFISSIKQFGYCDQLSYYDFLLREWLVEHCNGDYCDYKMLPPLNIVIDIGDKVPYVYEYDWKDIALAADGNAEFLYHLYDSRDHNSRVKKGWKKLLNEIGWHWYNNLWDKPRELYENKRIKINLLNN